MQNLQDFRGLHRNTFIKSPKVLDECLRLKNNKNIFFSGQITGVEGYVESTAIGNIVGRLISLLQKNRSISLPPKTTAHGALLSHLTKNAFKETFQPMNINFGLIDSFLDDKKVKGKDKKALQSKKALVDFENWTNSFI